MDKATTNLTFNFPVDPPASLKPKTNQLHGMTSIRNDLFWQAAISEIQTRIEVIEDKLTAAENGVASLLDKEEHPGPKGEFIETRKE